MKKLLILFFWLINIPLSATNYYVKTGGSDAANGLTDGTAWATITRVNTAWAAGTFNAGDNIYFNRGNTFTGTITVAESGSAGNPITIGAYGSGADPIISGFTTITAGWSVYSGSIYSHAVSVASAPLMVTVDGVHTPMGRTPNTGWTTIDSDTQYSLTDAHLNSAVTNWTGAEVVVKSNYYQIDHIPITSHSGTTLNYTAGTTWRPSSFDCNGYFIKNDIRTLDATNEWFYSGGTIYIYGNPAGKTVRVASIQNGVNISSRSYITIDNITFEGFNNDAIYLNTAPHVTIQNCTMSFIGVNAIEGAAYGAGASEYVLIDNNTINDINNAGILFQSQQFTHATISNNTMNNIGMIPGAGYGKNVAAYQAIQLGFYPIPDLLGSVIEYNRLTNIGYHGIFFWGQHCTVRYNYMNGVNMILDDGGGIYTYNESSSTSFASTISNNIILNSQGDGGGRVYSTYYQGFGIYTDGSSAGITITNNTIADCSLAGYFENGNTNGVLTGNTFWDNEYGIYIKSGIENMNFSNNILFARTSGEWTAMYINHPPSSATWDYNVYTRPIAETTTITDNPSNITLTAWKTASGKDAHSTTAGRTVASDAELHFVYNDSKVNESYTLSAPMYDALGTRYTYLTLTPFTSVVLIGAGTVTPYTEVEPLTVITVSVSAGTNQATAGGQVVYEGSSAVTARGVCWGASANPTVADTHTHDGSGTGTYVSSVTGLTPGTTYHLRAYATNATDTGYGSDVQFTTGSEVGLKGDPIFINGKILVDSNGKIIIK